MSEGLPSPGEFGLAFMEFMRAMQQAVDVPEPPWLVKLREHLGGEPAELPVFQSRHGSSRHLPAKPAAEHQLGLCGRIAE